MPSKIKSSPNPIKTKQSPLNSKSNLKANSNNSKLIKSSSNPNSSKLINSSSNPKIKIKKVKTINISGTKIKKMISSKVNSTVGKSKTNTITKIKKKNINPSKIKISPSMLKKSPNVVKTKMNNNGKFNLKKIKASGFVSNSSGGNKGVNNQINVNNQKKNSSLMNAKIQDKVVKEKKMEKIYRGKYVF